MALNQISVFIENKPGRLSSVTNILKEHGVDIRAMSIADTRDFGVLRFIVDRPEETAKLLKDSGYTVVVTPVLAAVMEDHPGSLAEILEALSQQGIELEYMYAFITQRAGKACVVMRVGQPQAERAKEILLEKGIVLAKGDDLRLL